MEAIKLNREQRRAYKRKHAHDPYAHYCPHCEMNTVWAMDREQNNVCCEICGNIVLRIPKEDDSDGTVSNEEGIGEDAGETVVNEDT